MLSSLTFTSVFLSTRAEKENAIFFLEEEENPPTILTGVVGRGESGVGDGRSSGTYGFGYSIGVSKRLTGS